MIQTIQTNTMDTSENSKLLSKLLNLIVDYELLNWSRELARLENNADASEIIKVSLTEAIEYYENLIEVESENL